MRPHESVEKCLGRLRVVAGREYDDRVGPGQSVEAVRGDDGETGRSGNRPGLGSAYEEPVPGHAELRPVDAEHLAGDAQLEG